MNSHYGFWKERCPHMVQYNYNAQNTSCISKILLHHIISHDFGPNTFSRISHFRKESLFLLLHIDKSCIQGMRRHYATILCYINIFKAVCYIKYQMQMYRNMTLYRAVCLCTRFYSTCLKLQTMHLYDYKRWCSYLYTCTHMFIHQCMVNLARYHNYRQWYYFTTYCSKLSFHDLEFLWIGNNAWYPRNKRLPKMKESTGVLYIHETVCK